MKRIMILVVDDDVDIVDFLVNCLRAEKYEVDCAYGGAEGLKKAKEVRPDLVILDLMMPDMHGFDVCQKLKADRFGGKVLISSAKGYATDQRAAQKLGADRFLVKPYTADQLLDAVRALVGNGTDS